MDDDDLDLTAYPHFTKVTSNNELVRGDIVACSMTLRQYWGPGVRPVRDDGEERCLLKKLDGTWDDNDPNMSEWTLDSACNVHKIPKAFVLQHLGVLITAAAEKYDMNIGDGFA